MRLLTATCLAAFATAATAEITLTDSFGRTVVLPETPERIVALYNENYGHLATLGVRPVATLVNPEMQRDEAYYFEDGLSIPTVANMDGSPDPEIVASFDPDLILTYSAEEAALFEGIAPTLALESWEGADGPADALRIVAQALGMEAEAEAAIAAFDARVAAYAARVPDRPSVLKFSGDGEGSFWFGTSADPVCPLLDRIVTCAWEDGPTGEIYQGTLEQLLALDPDVIVLNNWSELSDEDFLAALEADPLRQAARAVQEDRVVFLPEYSNPIFSSIAAGEKLVDTLIPAIFPEAFPTGALTEAEVAALTGEI
jgi:ABC-type Fe3+-hydroxamate transport system substrate-binding protein